MNSSYFGVTSSAISTDWLLLGLVLVSVAVLALVFGLMLFYLVRYRYNSPINRGDVAERSFGFEMSWTIATLVVFFGLFIWGSIIYVDDFQPPENALKIYVVAKQWMWKVEHAGGQREIDALHVPVNKPIELVMTSQDVIHDFFVPAFRLKRDVLPGQYETLWFKARKTGTYQLFCAQFCGTSHAAMVGDVTSVRAGLRGLAGAQRHQRHAGRAGHALFIAMAAMVATRRRWDRARAIADRAVRPSGTVVGRQNASSPTTPTSATSSCNPSEQVVASYAPVMPSFAGEIGEDDLVKLVAYVESLGAQPQPEGDQP